MLRPYRSNFVNNEYEAIFKTIHFCSRHLTHFLWTLRYQSYISYQWPKMAISAIDPIDWVPLKGVYWIYVLFASKMKFMTWQRKIQSDQSKRSDAPFEIDQYQFIWSQSIVSRNHLWCSKWMFHFLSHYSIVHNNTILNPKWDVLISFCSHWTPSRSEWENFIIWCRESKKKRIWSRFGGKIAYFSELKVSKVRRDSDFCSQSDMCTIEPWFELINLNVQYLLIETH